MWKISLWLRLVWEQIYVDIFPWDLKFDLNIFSETDTGQEGNGISTAFHGQQHIIFQVAAILLKQFNLPVNCMTVINHPWLMYSSNLCHNRSTDICTAKIATAKHIWVRSRNCGCLVTWFCYQLIAKPGNKTAAVSWPDPYELASF